MGVADHWFNFRLVALNTFTIRLFQTDRLRMNAWNDDVERLRPCSDAVVAEKAATVVAAHRPPEAFLGEVQSDALLLMMEFEHASVIPPGFYYGLSYWYLRGHYPCGWDGPLPEPGEPLQGRLIVL